jgi:putative MATE family efflux protein
MIGGIFAMSAFNLADAYFVAKLGTAELAAISFTFPVVMVVGAIAMGLGMGASIVVSRAIGGGERDQAKKLATSCLLLAMFVVAVFSAVGLLTMEPLFRLLGAEPDLMPMIKSYMTVWFVCVWVLIIPMVGNNCIRATGDMLTPGIIMIVLAVMNVILDPIFIFGYFGCPAMGIFGAALATVVSRGLGVILSLYILIHRLGLIDWKLPRVRETLRQWAGILRVALPAAATHLLMPLAMGFTTRLVADYGHEAVAAVGSGGRIIHLAYMIPIALGSVLIPFSGQNWGAGEYARVEQAWSLSNRFSLYYGLACTALSIPLLEPMARIFSDGNTFVFAFQLFLLISFAGSGLQHVAVHSGFVLNAIGYPIVALFFNAGRVFLLMCPLAWLGGMWLGMTGIFIGIALSQVIAGLGVRSALPAVIRSAVSPS